MQFQHTGMGLLLALVCITSSCSESEHDNLIGRWRGTGSPNLIFEEDGTVYSVYGPRRKGRYYLDTESEPNKLILDMRKSELNAVLYFDFDAISQKHIQLTPTYSRTVGKNKKEVQNKRIMLYEKLDPNDPMSGERRVTASATPNLSR